MTYKISEETIQQVKWRLILAALILSSSYIVLTAWSILRMGPGNRAVGVLVFSVFGSLLMMCVIFFWAARKTIRRFRGMELTLDKGTLRLSGTDGLKEIKFDSISKLTLFHNPEMLSILANGKRYVIAGYEGMEEIGEAVRRGVDPSRVGEKRRAFNVNNPVVFSALSVLSIVFVFGGMVVIRRVGLGKVANPLFLIGFGIYMAFFSPETMPRSAKKWSWVMIVLGVIVLVMILCGVGT